jgi:protein-glutamine gamma-glutamyltransferase
MIIIAGNSETDFDDSKLSALERSMYQAMKGSSFQYRYDSVAGLLFELGVRSHIVESARLLNESGVQFSDFEHSRCNPVYWDRIENGGFQLKSGVTPHEGIRDIFNNGRLYAFECATAVTIVLYKAVLESIGPQHFDMLFSDLMLYDWHFNSNLRLIDRMNPMEAVAGDILYFQNPDFDPATPWWRGENAILLGQDLYYGHGLGIKTSDEIVEGLNKSRKPGSFQSASLADRFDQLDFSYLWRIITSDRRKLIIAKVGARSYILNT